MASLHLIDANPDDMVARAKRFPLKIVSFCVLNAPLNDNSVFFQAYIMSTFCQCDTIPSKIPDGTSIEEGQEEYQSEKT